MIADVAQPAWVADRDLIAWTLDVFDEEACFMWTADEITAYLAMCDRLQIPPRSILAVMANEANCNPAAHNPGGAVGLIQFEPDTLRDEGWRQGTDAFAKLSVLEQLPYVERYFAARKTAILAAGGGIGAVYTATFLPALTAHAGDTTFVLCASSGPFAWAYAANKAFDRDNAGRITVADLVTAGETALARSGPATLWAAIEAAQAEDNADVAKALAALASLPPDTDPAPPSDT